MGDYGFSDDNENETVKIPLKSNRETVAPEELRKAAERGAGLGFVSREPNLKPTPRRTGRRKTEPQDKFLVTGPKRVLEAFKARCDNQGVPYWRMIEELMKAESN